MILSLTHDPREFVDLSPKPSPANDPLHTRSSISTVEERRQDRVNLAQCSFRPPEGLGFCLAGKGRGAGAYTVTGTGDLPGATSLLWV